MSEFLIFDVKTSATGPDVVTVTPPAGRHTGQLEPEEDSPQARAWRQQAQTVRFEADRDWIARRLQGRR